VIGAAPRASLTGSTPGNLGINFASTAVPKGRRQALRHHRKHDDPRKSELVLRFDALRVRLFVNAICNF